MTDTLVCEEIGVTTRRLRRWRDAVKEHGEADAFPRHGKARDQEVDRLRRKLKKVTEERDFFARSGQVLCQGVEVTYRCIHRRRHQHSIRMMCCLLQVSRSGYYDWSQRAESARSFRDRELRMLIRQIHLERNGVYGARKIHREPLTLGEVAGRHRVARLMRADGLKG